MSPIRESDRRVSVVIPPYLLVLARRRAHERGLSLSAYFRLCICQDLHVEAPVITRAPNTPR